MTTYTHKDWRIEATGIRDALDQLLAPALEHMRGDLVAMQAGREQLAKSDEFIRIVGELAEEGTRILGDHDARLRRVGEAQAAAGGTREVAGRKRYNQR